MTYAYAAPVQASNVSINTSGFDAVFSASPVVQLTLLLLVGLSVVCWAVGYTKWKEFKALHAANEPFLTRFFKDRNLKATFEHLDQHRGSSLARVFNSGMNEVLHPGDGTRADFHSVERTIRKAIDIEIANMEARLTLLATTGSTGPFIGLFGTVWGIMGSFHKIGVSGNASLAVVAPGISEALIATAIGLAAAIPAVVLYNQFIAKIRREEINLNNFASDFLNMARRQGLVVES